VIAGREDGEEGGLEAGDLLKQPRRLRALGAVLLRLVAEAVENEGLPAIALRDALLVRRHHLERRQRVARLQHTVELGSDRAPVRFQRCQLREQGRVENRRIADQRLAAEIPEQRADGALADLLDVAPAALAQPMQGTGFGGWIRRHKPNQRVCVPDEPTLATRTRWRLG